MTDSEPKSSSAHQQSKICSPATNEMHRIQLCKEQRKQAEYLQCLLTEVNDVAVDLYNIVEYAMASEMLQNSLNAIKGTIAPMQQDSCHREKEVASILLRQIVSGKEVHHSKNTSTQMTTLVEMDIYFSPSSLCDRYAFLSKPVKMPKCSLNEENKNEMEFSVIMFNLA